MGAMLMRITASCESISGPYSFTQGQSQDTARHVIDTHFGVSIQTASHHVVPRHRHSYLKPGVLTLLASHDVASNI
jgi:hypothetical protein